MKTKSPKPRRLTPREALHRFYAPRPTRRQVLGGLVVGVASIGCSGDEASSEGPEAPVGPTPAPPSGEVPDPALDVGGGSQPQPAGVGSVDGFSPGAAAGPLPTEPPGDVVAPATEPNDMAAVEPSPPTETPENPDGVVPEEEPAPSGVVSMEPSPAEPMEPAVMPMGRSAYDQIELGSTGIVTSRLAMGSGTNGTGGTSVQTRMGDAFSRLLVEGYERGIRFFETADAYGSHRLVGEALRQVGRQNVTLLTKTMAETREEAEADLERFMEELGVDYIDIVLLHIRVSGRWVQESEGAMEVLSEAKARGQIRAHGVSCHTLEALRLAAETDWVDLNLARINPFSLHMDSDPDTVKGVLDGMKAAGKAVVGMKILAQGDAVNRFDEAIEHATRLDCIHGFTLGFRSLDELDQVANKIASTTMG